MKKRGQVTIFIIIAILVVAIIAVIFAVSPKLRSSISGKTESPENFIQTCLEDVIKEYVDLISSQGVSLEPEPSVIYQDEKIQYLCYTPQSYQSCVVQIPFLKEHIESEIKENIGEDVSFCFNSLKEKYKDSNLKKGDLTVELLPNRIVATIDNEFTFTKSGETQTHKTFRVVVNNNLYELIGIAKGILEWEIVMGDSDEQSYMSYYHNLKIEKQRPFGDGTTMYTLTDRNTQDKFRFAVRSFVLR